MKKICSLLMLFAFVAFSGCTSKIVEAPKNNDVPLKTLPNMKTAKNIQWEKSSNAGCKEYLTLTEESLKQIIQSATPISEDRRSRPALHTKNTTLISEGSHFFPTAHAVSPYFDCYSGSFETLEGNYHFALQYDSVNKILALTFPNGTSESYDFHYQGDSKIDNSETTQTSKSSYVTLQNLPNVQTAKNIQLKRNVNSGCEENWNLNEKSFKQIMQSAKPISKDDLRISPQWSSIYNLCYEGSFETAEGRYTFELGYNPEELGTFILPNGNYAAFSFQYQPDSKVEEAKAVELIGKQFPEFQNFPGKRFGGGTIRTLKDSGKWVVLFITHGSGVPIVSSTCFLVENDQATEINNSGGSFDVSAYSVQNNTTSEVKKNDQKIDKTQLNKQCLQLLNEEKEVFELQSLPQV